MATEVIIAGRLPFSSAFCHLCNNPDVNVLSTEGCVLLERFFVLQTVNDEKQNETISQSFLPNMLCKGNSNLENQ